MFGVLTRQREQSVESPFLLITARSGQEQIGALLRSYQGFVQSRVHLEERRRASSCVRRDRPWQLLTGANRTKRPTPTPFRFGPTRDLGIDLRTTLLPIASALHNLRDERRFLVTVRFWSGRLGGRSL